jgi:hypothetical protein
LKYLAPYLFRVEISNRNILDVQDGQVTFRYRDSKTNTTRITTLPAEQSSAGFYITCSHEASRRCGPTDSSIPNSATS